MNPAALFLFLVVILLFVSVSWGWYFYLKIRNKERMALIEKDKDVSEIYARPKTKFGFHFPLAEGWNYFNWLFNRMDGCNDCF
jgi:hypothetical protein